MALNTSVNDASYQTALLLRTKLDQLMAEIKTIQLSVNAAASAASASSTDSRSAANQAQTLLTAVRAAQAAAEAASAQATAIAGSISLSPINFASTAEAQAGASTTKAMSPATTLAAITHLLASLPTTPPNTAGLLWLDNNKVSISVAPAPVVTPTVTGALAKYIAFGILGVPFN